MTSDQRRRWRAGRRARVRRLSRHSRAVRQLHALLMPSRQLRGGLPAHGTRRSNDVGFLRIRHPQASAPSRPRVHRTLPSREKPPGTRQPAPATTTTSAKAGRRRSAAGTPRRITQFLQSRGRMRGRPIKRTLRETQHPEDRRQEAFSLPQGQVEDEPERQRGFDGEIGIRPLPTTFADPHGLPSGDRIRGQPHGDIAALDQRSVVCRSISDVVLCRVLRVHARLHIEIMHLLSPRWPGGRSWLTEGAGSVHQRPTMSSQPPACRTIPLGELDISRLPWSPTSGVATRRPRINPRHPETRCRRRRRG